MISTMDLTKTSENTYTCNFTGFGKLYLKSNLYLKDMHIFKYNLHSMLLPILFPTVYTTLHITHYTGPYTSLYII